MKTDHDLLDEMIRLLFERQGATPEQIKLIQAQRRQAFALKPAKPLTDAEYHAKLEQAKKELPSFAEHLDQLPEQPLPPRHTGQNN